MKKLFVFTYFLLLGLRMIANPITPDKALSVASKVFESDFTSTKALDGRNRQLSIMWDGEFEHTKAADNPALYVVTREGGGFVIVSGDDNVLPIIAVSFEDSFCIDNMPDNVRCWIEQYKNEVRSAHNASSEIRRHWALFDERTKSEGFDYVPDSDGPPGVAWEDVEERTRTNKWNQTNPANYLCPDIEGQSETSVCGCTALAVAEVMAWWGSDNIKHATGTAPSYSYNSKNKKYVTIASQPLYESDFEWEQLHSLYSASAFYDLVEGYNPNLPLGDQRGILYSGKNKGTVSLKPLGENLAHLVDDIGVLLKSKYNMDSLGTGAQLADIIRAVAPVMGYNRGARLVNKDFYTNGEWELLLKEEIRQLRPVIYGGERVITIPEEVHSKHAYIADGFGTYNGKQLFHFNFGWGGMANGYYNLNIQAIESPTQTDVGRYSLHHSAILGFFPDNSHSEAIPVLGFYGENSGFEYVSGKNTETIEFKVNNIWNLGSADFDGDIYALCIKGSTGIIVESEKIVTGIGIKSLPIATIPDPTNPDLSGIFTNDYLKTISDGITFPSPVFGDKIEVRYLEDGKEGLNLQPFAYEPLNVGLIALPVFPGAGIKTNQSYMKDDYFVFELTNHDYDYRNSTWYLTSPSGDTKSFSMDNYRVKLTEVGEYKIVVIIPGQEKVIAFIEVSAN